MKPFEKDTWKAICFLRDIGLKVETKPNAGGFFPGIEIAEGILLVDPKCVISDLLHEAGHVAITPGCFRHLLGGNLDEAFQRVFEELARLGVMPEEPLYRAVMQCSDPEATAWAWAAGVKLGLAGDSVIPDGDYDGDEACLRFLLKNRKYLGIHGLAAAGFCSVNRIGGFDPFPTLAFWTQEIEWVEIT